MPWWCAMNERTTALGLPARQARRRVVDRLVQAESSGEPVGGEPLQVEARRLGRHHQRERRGVGRDDEILRESALQPEAGHAEGAVLVVEARVDRVVAGFRDAPGHAALLPVGDLPLHRRATGLVEQRVVVRRHHQQRHQVLEHRAAPRQEHRSPPGGREQAPEREPVLLRQLSLRDRHEAREPRFRGEQVVVARIAPALADVVADGQQVARLVVEEVVLHAGQLVALQRQALDLRHPLGGATARFGDGPAEFVEPCAVRRRRVRAPPALDGRQQFRFERRELAQRRDLADAREVAEPARRGRQRAPRREKRELVPHDPALADEGVRPERRFARRRRRVGGSAAGMPATCAATSAMPASSRSSHCRAAAMVAGRES